MRRQSRLAVAMAAAALSALAAMGTPGGSLAQTAGGDRGAGEAGAPVPDGFYVTPQRPVPKPLLPERDWSPPEVDMRQLKPDDRMQGGGCRYQERKLELIV